MILLPDQIFTWIANIISSCNNDFQFSCVDKLIELFQQRFPEEEGFSVSLKQLREEQEQTVQGIKANTSPLK